MMLVRMMSRLPFGVLYAISDFLFVVTYYFIRYRRKLVWKNLINAFPLKTSDELRRIEKEFYRNLCDYGVEMLKLLTISQQELGKRVIFKNPEIANKYILAGQSLLNLASHHFNWEWLLTAGSFSLPGEMDFVYQPVNSDFFDRFSLLSRTRFGAHAIKRDAVAREMVKRKNVVRNIALVGDQYPGYGHDKKFPTTFMHQETVFFYGSVQIALLTQYPVMYYAMRKVRRGFYEATIVEISEPPYDKDNKTIIEKYIREIEKLIHEDPSAWLWSHNRWKKRHL
ncbi:MAG TPA: lysophospholipid acyltransferase family protein [Chryseolinea sp.]|nr:lysophospholipid acyltransferase family protein [Chryseolinea sp.]